MLTPQKIIDQLGLEPLVEEGGMYRCNYISDLSINVDHLPERYRERETEKPLSTAIYYLLMDQAFSHMHRLPTDEIYHFYLGDPVELTILKADGTAETLCLGQDILSDMHVQVVVPAGSWHGSRLKPGSRFALLGTTMAPGYTPSDYEHGDRETLKNQYTQASEQIEALTRVDRLEMTGEEGDSDA